MPKEIWHCLFTFAVTKQNVLIVTVKPLWVKVYIYQIIIIFSVQLGRLLHVIVLREFIRF